MSYIHHGPTPRSIARCGRHGLADLMEAARRGEFASIIVSDSLQISRDLRELMMILEELNGLGIALLSVAEGPLGPDRRNEVLLSHMIADAGRPYRVRRRRPSPTARGTKTHG